MDRSDTKLTYKLSVPCPNKTLVLVNNPTFREGEIIEGIIELTSPDYWEVTTGQERKYSVQLKAYFKTEVVKQENQ